MPEPAHLIADPRTFPAIASAPTRARRLYAMADASLKAETRQRADAIDRDLRRQLAARLTGDGPSLAADLAGAPSVAIARHLWRVLDAAWRETEVAEGAGLSVTVFALPLVIVAGLGGAEGDATLSGCVEDPLKLAKILVEGGALAGNRTVALANALVGLDAIDVARLPEIRAWARLPDALGPGASLPSQTLVPSPIAVHAARETVHLRFLIGTAIAKPGADLLADRVVGEWGAPFTRELARQLATGRVSALALPRAPQRPLPAVAQGLSAQRDVSAQIFASNAIRRFRGSVGEPTAVISAHRASCAPGCGELRLSLSSPLDPRAAEGFRCPLYPLDRAGDVAVMLVELLRDCRVTDIRMLGGVHADRVPGTGLPLLFKPDTIPGATAVVLH